MNSGSGKDTGMFFIVDNKNDSNTSTAYTNYMYSTDGINWNIGNFPFANHWKKVTFGNGMYIAVGCSNYDARTTNQYAYSSDGINWSIGTFPSADHWFSVEYGNGVFVVVRSSSAGNLYSDDGINWNVGNLGNGNAKWGNVVFNNGMFHALNYSSLTTNLLAYSTNGSSWQYVNLNKTQNWSTVVYGKEVFALVQRATDATNTFQYSSDGVFWTPGTNPATAMSCTDACFFNKKFIGTAQASSSSWQKYVWTSTDGKAWNYEQVLPIDNQWVSVDNNLSICIMTGINSNQYCYTNNGINWSNGILPLTLVQPVVFWAGE